MRVSVPLAPDDFVQEGCNPAPGVLILAATVGDDEDAPRNRVLVGRDGQWLDFTTRGEAVVSVDATASGAAYVLGERGSVVAFDWRCPDRASLRASRSIVLNPAPLSLGPLRRIRVVDGLPVTVGSVGQAYARTGKHFRGLATLAAETVEDATGFEGDLIAVTAEGTVSALRSGAWVGLGAPGCASLSAVAGWGSQLAVAGDGVHVGRGGAWESVGVPGRRYWGVAASDTVYAAHLGGVDRLLDGAMVPVPLELASDDTFAVLRSGPDGVFAFHGTTILQVQAGSGS